MSIAQPPHPAAGRRVGACASARILIATLASGTIWWVGWKVLQYVERGSQLTFDPNDDYRLLLMSGQMPWGHGGFLWLPLVLAVLTALAATTVVGLAHWRSATLVAQLISVSSKRDLWTSV